MLTDVTGKIIVSGDLVSIATNRFNKIGAEHDITTISEVNPEDKTVVLIDGEVVDTTIYELLILCTKEDKEDEN